jgi:hypothetical protein
LVSLLLVECSPRISSVSYEENFKKWNREKKLNEIDTSASLSIEYNTAKGFFAGRIEALGFKKNYYFIDFKKIDSIYTQKDIMNFSVIGYKINRIPQYCKVRIQHLNEIKVIVEFEIKDDSIQDILKGRFKLKLDREFPEHYDVFKYYKN